MKFNVWNKEKKCWMDCDEIFISQDGEVYEIEERSWAYQSYMHKENITEKVEIVRFTGLFDKNGKEIYEGDILEYTSNERVDTRGSYKRSYAVYEDIEIRGVVKFGQFKDNLMFYVESPQAVSYDSYFFSDSKNRAPRVWTDNLSKPLFPKREYEVIGNIYTNPELLGEDKP